MLQVCGLHCADEEKKREPREATLSVSHPRDIMAEAGKHLAWDDFRLVKAVADAKGLPGAAEALGVNHSTVFRRLGQIEASLGAKLFDRHRAGYAATAAGEAMLAVAQRLDDEITDFSRKLAGRRPSPAGELRVTTNDSLLVHLLTPIFARFCAACPEVRLDLVVGNQALNLSKRDADVAIRATDTPPETLVGRRVAHIAWALYGRRDEFPEAGGPPEAEGLRLRRWVSLGDGFAGVKAVRFVRDEVAPERIVYKIDTVLGLAEAVEAGIGIGHLPCFIADARPDLRRLAPPVPAFGADLWLLTHADLRHSARVRVFLDFVAAAVAKEKRRIEGEVPSAGR